MQPLLANILQRIVIIGFLSVLGVGFFYSS